MNNAVPILVMLAIALAPPPANAGEAEDAAAFREVRAKLKAALPEGWELVVKLDRSRTTDLAHPTIVIRSKNKIPIQRIPPSSGGLPPSNPQKNPFLKAEVVEIELRSSPIMPPKQWLALWKQNQVFRKQRWNFGKAHFRGMSWYDVKSGVPYAAERLKPRTALQKKRIIEYAFLRLRTEPRELPSYHFKSLSFTRSEMPYTMFQDKRDGKRYAKISAAIEKVLTEYKRPMK